MITEVTHEGFFSRIGNAIKGVLFGIVLTLAAFPVLWINEGRSVQTAKSLDEGSGAVVTASADKVDPANESKLVYISSKAVTDDTLEDKEFGISIQAIRLKRLVEMYQWQEKKNTETKKKIGGGTKTITTYTYHKKWSESLIKSSGFKETAGHSNPSQKPYKSKTLTAKKVTAGAYTLSDSLISQISNDQELEPKVEDLPEPVADIVKPHNKSLYIGENPGTPAIGDTRITWKQTPPTEVSVISQQTGETFQPYQTQAGDALDMLRVGKHSSEEMFKLALADNVVLTWILRGLGLLMMLIGLALIMRPMAVVADIIPFIGDLVGAGTVMVAGLGAVAGTRLTIGIAWIFYRPLIGAPLVAVTIGLLVFLFMRGRSNKKQAAIAEK